MFNICGACCIINESTKKAHEISHSEVGCSLESEAFWWLQIVYYDGSSCLSDTIVVSTMLRICAVFENTDCHHVPQVILPDNLVDSSYTSNMYVA